ncbi:MAG: Crp/Fnr family transcriptional regulator, partial [Gammaproteobacteria bacterium]
MKKNSIDAAWRGAERCRSCGIRHMVLFADLEQGDFDRIHLPIDEIDLEPGQVLYRQDEDAPFVYTVRSGLVKLIQGLPSGEWRIVRLLRQGDLAGLDRLAGNSYTHDAVALDNVRLCRIPLSVVDTLRRDTPHLHDGLMTRWQRALVGADDWITRLSTGNSKRRVARLLLMLDEASEDDSFFLPTREDMGAMLGITTESASKATAEFKRQGWLKNVMSNRAV